MTKVEFDQTLWQIQNRGPFKPFSVALRCGKQFEVDRANAFVVRDGSAVFVAKGGRPVLFDHDNVYEIRA